MRVIIRGIVNDIRRTSRDGKDYVHTYVYDNSSEPALYKISGDVKLPPGTEADIPCKARAFKDQIYLTYLGD